jgi:hypothetical protein
MGRQYNKNEKRRRRQRYLNRKKDLAKQPKGAKAKSASAPA